MDSNAIWFEILWINQHTSGKISQVIDGLKDAAIDSLKHSNHDQKKQGEKGWICSKIKAKQVQRKDIAGTINEALAWSPSSPRNRDDLSRVLDTMPATGRSGNSCNVFYHTMPYKASIRHALTYDELHDVRPPHRIGSVAGAAREALHWGEHRRERVQHAAAHTHLHLVAPRSRCYHVTKHRIVAVRRRRLLNQTLHHCLSHSHWENPYR